MIHDNIRKTQTAEAIFRQAMAGVRWKEVHADVMAELSIDPADIDAKLAEKRSIGLTAFSADELSKLDDYVESWNALVNSTGPGLIPLHERKTQIKALLDTLYKDIFDGLTPPEIVFCESPAKLAVYTKAFTVRYGDKDDFSTDRFRQVVAQVVTDLTPEEQESFTAPLLNEFSRLYEELGPGLRGKVLTYRLFEHVFHNLYGELKAQSTDILKTDESDYYNHGFQSRFEPLHRRLSIIFDIDFRFDVPDVNTNWRELEVMMSARGAFDRETWGLWRGSFIVGAGFLMEHMSKRGRFSTACESELSKWLSLFRLAPWYTFFEKFCLVGMYPLEVHVDEQLRLNNRHGAAASYADGWKLWAIDGNRMPRRMVENPQSLTVDDIRQAQNVNVRRMMLDMYGASRYIEESGSRLIHKDEYGELYQQELPGDEPLTMVCVINATVETDGTYRRYFLRVPPDITTAQEAVAWTFGMRSAEYSPDVQT